MAGSNPPNSFVYLKMLYIYEKEKTMQKNRFYRLPKPLRINHGNSAFLTDSEGRLELVQIAFIKKKLKKRLVKVDLRIEMQLQKVWFCITPNFLIQKKSKNSRMGKGKGLVERKCIRLRKNVPIFEFYGFSFLLLKKILIKINKKLNLKLKFVRIVTEETKFWGSNNRYVKLFQKYINV